MNRHELHSACTGKIRYSNPAVAYPVYVELATKIVPSPEKCPLTLCIYACAFCGGCHLGNRDARHNRSRRAIMREQLARPIIQRLVKERLAIL